MRRSKRVMSILLSFLFVLFLLPTESMVASAYDANAAVAFARDHWDDGIGLCAEFVARCLAAGGVSIPNKASYYSSSKMSYKGIGGTLGVYTNPYTCSEAQLVYFQEQGYAIIENPSDSQISVGDVLFLYGSTQSTSTRDDHVGICISTDNGITYAAHNRATVTGKLYSSYPCTYVVKMNGSTTYTEPPTKPIVQLDKTIGLVNQDFTIRFSSERVSSYWIGISRNGTFIEQEIIHTNEYTVNLSQSGEYGIALVARNNCGSTETSYASFRLGTNGDYPISDFTVSCDNPTPLRGEDIHLTFLATNAGSYWIGIYTANGYLYDQESVSTNFLTTRLPWAGQYSIAIVAINDCSPSVTKYISVTVLDQDAVPQKPTISIEKNIFLTNQEVVIHFASQYANDYWVGIYKDNVLFNDTSTTDNSYTVSYQWVGKYDVVVVARNSYGSSESYASFYVGTEGDYVPRNFSLTGNKTIALRNEAVIVTFNADFADDYWIGVYHNGQWLGTDAVTGHTFTMRYSDLGEYSVAVVARNACSSTDAKYFKFKVVDQKDFTIQYVSHSGNGAPASQTKTYGQTLTLTTEIPTRSGYTFTGWNTKADGSGTNYAPGETYTVETDVTLYAQWVANPPAVNPAVGSGTVVDESTHFIYGLSASAAQGCVAVTDGTAAYEYSNTKQTFGTGTIVNIYNNDNDLVDSYTIVVFGDINGDGWYDGTDAYFVSLVANGLISPTALTEAQLLAADANHDDAIDAADAALLEQAGLLLSQVDQNMPPEELELNSIYLEYCSLIDQSVTITEPDQPATEQPQSTAQNILAWFRTIFTVVLNWLLRVF